MTQEQFFQLMRSPHSRVDIPANELAQLVEQFPYSQPLRFIYLRQLEEQNSIHYSLSPDFVNNANEIPGGMDY